MNVKPETFVALIPEKKIDFFDKNIYLDHQITFNGDLVASKFTADAIGEQQAVGCWNSFQLSICSFFSMGFSHRYWINKLF